ncbi:XVIPCD domain-containing protein, partial [Lysobacter sp. 2RAB21]
AERTTAALLVSSRLAGLEQINHVVPGRNTPAGTDVFAVQGELHDPAHKRAHVNTVIAAQIPVEVSFQKLAAAEQRAALVQEQSQEQTRSQAPHTV